MAKHLTTATESEDPNQTERAVCEREPAWEKEKIQQQQKQEKNILQTEKTIQQGHKFHDKKI